ncbi:class II aldolase and adducin N-terminal domain-containing protein [Metapseudomonas furukawaii]|uniref:Ribulose-5-phosphate 4-epimerase and related epimerases and aldolases n=1 Tax=Metapseudomonas furukawaii TaxID=1149133 RepID=L8MHC0_METFU|nr:class II aldolase and adducin N-terminal domain-containing protein [Pseudomonas furukawaii]ELS25408.1 Ribulose-5-phosphate 4-epimerase [Pseudomonas furukawaii]ELS29160.1 Ribulose-5-phosphate 4-epimerase [Pseudomonas furukawaii]WAG81126.1 class II aldolase and adducin N-terminal domain-containing protein [Pseudomonas furukawaii]BAU73939.1 ribulose-5-phosphate 4-epimerase and related epimerases and aldolases [Pseudomonas furukawaii]
MNEHNHWQARVDLACAFRWAARLGLHEAIANHFSLAVSADGREFLINPYGKHFSEIRASDLILVNADDPGTLDRPDAPDITAWALHGALHRNQPQARCVLHTHSRYATALACLADSRLPPIEQNCMRFFERLAIDEGFDGMGLGDEAERVSRLLDGKPVLLLGSHGVMVAATSVAQAFDDLYYFERACEIYLTALATGRPLRIASDEVARKTARQWLEYPDFAEKHFAALKRILDREEAGYSS